VSVLQGYEGQLAASAAELEARTEELRIQGRKLTTTCRERDSNLSALLQKEEQQEHEAAAFQHTYDDLSSELAAVQVGVRGSACALLPVASLCSAWHWHTSVLPCKGTHK
jgi:chromosome segregation ATPase